VVVQPISEFNRAATAEHGEGRVPSRIDEVETLFSRRRQLLPQVRKYLPAAPRRHGRLTVTPGRASDQRGGDAGIRDRRPDLGEVGTLHVRLGKESSGRGVKPRMVPGINAVAALPQ
jgi:hypothetical protein